MRRYGSFLFFIFKFFFSFYSILLSNSFMWKLFSLYFSLSLFFYLFFHEHATIFTMINIAFFFFWKRAIFVYMRKKRINDQSELFIQRNYYFIIDYRNTLVYNKHREKIRFNFLIIYYIW